MQAFRVTGWNDVYENNRTRDLKSMEWVPVPNKMDGDGYTELLDHPNGAAHYGAWHAIVKVASKCAPRGTLLRSAQKAHDAHSLSRITRVAVQVFEEAIPRLIEIGWLESVLVVSTVVTSIPQEGAAIPQEGAGKPQEGAAQRPWNGMEGKGMEENGKEEKCAAGAAASLSAPSAPFATFWQAWPSGDRKVNRKGCARHWHAAKLDAQAAEIIAGLVRWKGSALWKQDGGKFIPLPMTWLHQTRWEAHPEPSTPGADESGFVRREFSEDEMRDDLGLTAEQIEEAKAL